MGVTIRQVEEGDEEVFVDFRSNKKGDLILKVRNLIDKDPEIKKRVQKLDKDHLNILHIFVDTVSRNNFYRKYKKTTKFL
jgi:hypothetical protein